MKSILAYYAAICIPFGLLVFTKNHHISSIQFVWMLFVYALVYRPAISGVRLIDFIKLNARNF